LDISGEPKSIQHPTGSHAVVNKWTMKNLYGLSPGECWWAASDIGWVVGHEYICYSPLLNGNTTVMYEGKPVGTPDAGQFFRVISEHNVAGCFLTPTAVRAIKAVDINAAEGKKYDISCLKYMFIAGEPCDLNTRNWAEEHFNVPVLNNWWQTETAHAITATCVGLGNRLDPPKTSAGKPVPGFDVRVIKEDGNEAGIGQLGRIVCKLPIAPGTMTTLFKAGQRFKDTYFSNYIGKNSHFL
jgi:propionyl-CoA synthetase